MVIRMLIVRNTLGCFSTAISVLRHNEWVRELNVNNTKIANGTKNNVTIKTSFCTYEVTVSKNPRVEQKNV